MWIRYGDELQGLQMVRRVKQKNDSDLGMLVCTALRSNRAR